MHHQSVNLGRKVEALGQRFAEAELTNDDADIPSWKKVE